MHAILMAVCLTADPAVASLNLDPFALPTDPAVLALQDKVDRLVSAVEMQQHDLGHVREAILSIHDTIGGNPDAPDDETPDIVPQRSQDAVPEPVGGTRPDYPTRPRRGVWYAPTGRSWRSMSIDDWLRHLTRPDGHHRIPRHLLVGLSATQLAAVAGDSHNGGVRWDYLRGERPVEATQPVEWQRVRVRTSCNGRSCSYGWRWQRKR